MPSETEVVSVEVRNRYSQATITLRGPEQEITLDSRYSAMRQYDIGVAQKSIAPACRHHTRTMERKATP